MTVKATCSDCRDEHDLGDRTSVPGTTACPECESCSYRSTPIITESAGSTQLDPETLQSIDGVGNSVSEAIVTKYTTATDIESVDELCEIDHIGPTVAQRIVDAISA